MSPTTAKKWWPIPLNLVALLGVLGLPNFSPTDGLLWTVGTAQAATAQNSPDDKQRLSNEAARSPAAMLLADPRAATSYLEVAVDNTGNFTCGIPAGPIMLYGHPNPWSSAATIRVDGTDHWNYNKTMLGTVVTPPADLDAVTNESVWDIDGIVKVTENLKIIKGDSGNDDTLQISYTALNQDSVAHNVGVRVMLDTMLGSNDGAPFRIPEVGEVTTEREFTGADVPLYWEAFENLTNVASAKARGTLLNSEDMPTRVVFADWGHINDTPWSFVVNPAYVVTGDSAVGVYWDPVAVQPGASITRTTFYGLSGMAVVGNVALSLPVTTLSVESGSYAPNPFPVTAYVSNTGTLTMSGVTATLTLPAGLVLESGTLAQTIGTVARATSKQVSWSVMATGEVTGTLTISASLQGTNLPVRTVSETITVPVMPDAATTTTLSATPNPSDRGQDVTLNAVVTAADGKTPTGDVAFNVDGAVVATKALASGTASHTASGLTVGTHPAYVNYVGATGFTASVSPNVTVTVRPVVVDTTTAITVSSPIVNGQPVTITANVTSSNGAVPTGNVTFKLDGSVVATQALANGSASYTSPSNLAAGSHTVIVNYAGVTDSFNASSTQATFAVPQPAVSNLPTAITLDATLVTINSVKLNGRVTPNGSQTTVNFDFGYSEAYGFTVATAPTTIPGAAGVTVIGAAKTGLNCDTEYHYRTQATNAGGTVYGVDKNFKTPICGPIADAWLYKPNDIVMVGDKFEQYIHINTKGGTVGGYDFDITFDNTKMIVDTMFQNAAGTCYKHEDGSGTGVCPGVSALGAPMVITDNNAGTIKLIAFDPIGVGPSNDLPVVEIHFTARSVTGIHPIDLAVTDLIDPLGDPIGDQTGRGSNIAVTYGRCGDADGNKTVNIVDALSVARKIINLPPPPTINTNLGDVNRDTRLSIADSLHIARHSVGLQIGAINACAIGLPLPPGDQPAFFT